MTQAKLKVKFTYDDAKDLIFVYENMNILSNKTMREIIKPIIGKIIDYLDTNELTISSNIREVYIDGIWNKDDESQWLTQIQIPIE